MQSQNMVLMNAEEVSAKYFGGHRSAWCLLQDVKAKRLPAIHIGKRVFFELNTLNQFLQNKMKDSMQGIN